MTKNTSEFISIFMASPDTPPIFLKEIREWVQLLFIVIGGIIGLIAFRQNMKQRRLENAIKMVTSFRESLGPEGLSPWYALMKKTTGSLRLSPGYYVDNNGNHKHIRDYFYENSPDNRAIQKIAENLEIICFEMLQNNIDIKYIWFELGQILDSVHYWTSNTHESENPLETNNFATILKSRFPNLEQIFQKHGRNFKPWPTKRYDFDRVA